MTTNEAGVPFSRTIGGYDATEAARVITDLRATLAAYEDAFAKADAEVRRLERKLQDRQRSKPKFAELGAAFESAITLAEEQAATLIADAQSDTRSQVAGAKSDAKSRSQAAALQSRNAHSSATREAEQIRIRAEQDAARQRQAIKDVRHTVDEERAQVDRIAAAVLADAESQIAALRLQANVEMDRDLAAAHDELRRSTDLAQRIDEETRVLNENAANEIASILGAAEAYSAQTMGEADAHTEESYKRADDVAAETENYVSASQSRAATILDEARARSEHALANAEKITGEITAASQDFVANMTRDLEERLEKARRNLEDISGFLYQVRMLTNGFDLGELSVARSRVSTDRSNSSVNVAELLDD